MKRYLGAATLVMLLAACGGDGGGAGTGDGVGAAAVTAGCDVPLAGMCVTITTTQATWDSLGGQDAWAKQCAPGTSGYPGTVVTDCPAANRVGRCAVTFSSGSSSAVGVYRYYAPGFTADQAVQTCVAIQGAFTPG